MTVSHKSFDVMTRGSGTIEITSQVLKTVTEVGATEGMCTVFVHHTSASVIINENADPDVQRDLEAFLRRLVPNGDPLFIHTAEGADDMPAHIKTALTQTSLNIPIIDGHCALGTWQGVFLWEHRDASHRRKITVSVVS